MARNTKKDLRRTLKLVIVGLALTAAILHISTVILASTNNEIFEQYIKLFDLDGEHNVPSTYTGLLLGCCAFICLVLVTQKNQLFERLRWIFLNCLFFYLAFDEILIIHETFARPLRNFFSISAGNIFYHAWVIPGIVIALLIAAISVLIKGRGQISRLQKTIFSLIFVLALGDILLEILGTKLYFSSTIYKLGPVLVEEMFEIAMISLILFKLTVSTYSLR